MSQAAIGKKARRSRSIVPALPSVEKESNTSDVTGPVAGAGLGVRLGQGPKAFLELGGKTLLRPVVETFRPCVSSVRVRRAGGAAGSGGDRLGRERWCGAHGRGREPAADLPAPARTVDPGAAWQNPGAGQDCTWRGDQR